MPAKHAIQIRCRWLICQGLPPADCTSCSSARAFAIKAMFSRLRASRWACLACSSAWSVATWQQQQQQQQQHWQLIELSPRCTAFPTQQSVSTSDSCECWSHQWKDSAQETAVSKFAMPYAHQKCTLGSAQCTVAPPAVTVEKPSADTAPLSCAQSTHNMAQSVAG